MCRWAFRVRNGLQTQLEPSYAELDLHRLAVGILRLSVQPPGSGLGPPSDTERAVYGPVTSEEMYVFLDDYARQRLGSGIARIQFRSGRIDVVWGVDLDDGRAVVLKIHRPPANPEALRVVAEALRLLSTASFPARLRCRDPTKPMDVS